jgi:hypothetical protein
MKIITRDIDLLSEFKRLSHQYAHFYWAGFNSELLAELMPDEQKIKKIIIGIQFYQTHPKVIQTFIENKNVRFKHQPENILHHKIYLFCNNINEWEVIISCSSFIDGSCAANNEALILITNQQMYIPDLYHKAMQLIDEHWKDAISFNFSKLEEYKKKWESNEQNNTFKQEEIVKK